MNRSPKKSVTHRRKPLLTVTIEAMETRRLLSGVVDSWTGQAGDHLWSTANNWRTFNNQIVIPSTGQDINLNLYNGSAFTQTTIDTGADRTIGDTFLQNVILNNNTLTLHGSLSGEYSTVNSNVVLDHTLTFNGSIGSPIRFAGDISDGGNNFGVLVNNGALAYQSTTNAPVSYTGPTTIPTFGSLYLLNRPMNSYVTLNGANSHFYVAGDGIGFASTHGSIEISNGSANATPATPTENGDVTLDGGTEIEFNLVDDAHGGAAASSQLRVSSGTVTLGGAILTLYPGTGQGASLTVGDSYTIIANNTGHDVDGTFHDLPEGTRFINGNYDTFEISYHGGVSGHDVVATVVQTSSGNASNPDVTLQINRTAARLGNSVTVTANITGDDGNGHMPTGSIQFYEDSTAYGSPLTIQNGSVSFTTTSLPLGGHSFTATYEGDSNFPVFDTELVHRSVGVNVSAPIVFNNFSGGNVMSGKSHHFDALVTSPNSSEPQLTYTWSTAKAPSGAKPVVFSDNNTNSAKSEDIRVYKDGVYRFTLTVSDSYGSSSEDVYLDVHQTATTMRLTPHAVTIAKNSTRQFGGVVLDQFNHAMRAGDPLTWSILSGPGSITSGGLFSATSMGGHVSLEAEADGLLATLGAKVA